LILVNPAPEFPPSGSAVAELDALDENTCKWDQKLYARTSTDKPKRGRLVSRGTLVVCHVSLVGQWVEEAKSKLTNPGMVYQYHGSSRKRDPKILSRAAIVVTTYETLASDATYHAKKSKSGNYVPPLEQVRWWRIIADESHTLRESTTTKSRAVMSLVGDIKWLVSGAICI